MKNRHIMMMFLAGLALAGCSEFVGLFESEEVAMAPYELGKQHFADASYAQAVEQFQQVVSAAPDSVPALNGLAASYDQMGRFDLAERYYKRALSIAPDSAQTLNNLGVSYMMQDRPDLAAVYLTEARVQDDADPGIAANHAAAAAAIEAQPTARRAVLVPPAAAERPIRRMTAAVQRLLTQAPASLTVPIPRPRPASEHVLTSASGLSIELSMLEPLEATAGASRPAPAGDDVKGDESPRPYSSLTIEIGESMEAS